MEEELAERLETVVTTDDIPEADRIGGRSLTCARCGLPIEGEGTTAEHLPSARVHEDCPTGAYPKFNLMTVSQWMREELRKDSPIGLEQLVEGAAAAFKVDQKPGGPLDDPEHWIWETAAGALAWWAEQPKLTVIR